MTKYLIWFLRIALYAVLLTPFFIHRSTIYPFITLNTLFFQAVMLLALAGWGTLTLFEPRFRPRVTPLFFAGVVFVGVLFLTAFLGSDPWRSLWSTPERMLGVIGYTFLFAYFLMLVSLFRAGEISLKKYLTAEFLVSFCVAAVAYWQFLNPTLFFGIDLSSRVGSLWGNSAYLAIYLIFNIFVGAWLAKDSYRGWISAVLWLGIIAEFILVFITQTRAGIAGLLVGVVLLLFYFAFKKRDKDERGLSWWKNSRKISIFLTILIILFSGLFVATKTNSFWLGVPGLNRLSLLSAESLVRSDRYVVWKIAWEGFLDKPVLGYGPENFVIPFGTHYDPNFLSFGKGHVFDRPHNIFLEYLTASGVVGLLSYLFLIGAALFSLRGRARPFLGAAIIAYLVQAALSFDTLASLLPLFAILGAIDYLYKNEPGKGKPLLPISYTIPVFAVFLAVVTVLGYFIIAEPLYRNHQHFKGEWSVNQKDFPGAIKYFDEALAGSPNLYGDFVRVDFAGAFNLITRSGLVKFLPSPKENLKKAAAGIDVAMFHHPQDLTYKIIAINLNNSAFAATADANYLTRAKEIEREAVALNPRKQEVYYGIIETKILEVKYEEALQIIEEVIHFTKEDYALDAHYLRGIIFIGQGKAKEGAKEIHEAIGRGYKFENYAQARLTADRLGDAGYYDEAITLYRRAVELNPADSESKLKVGIVYYLKADFEKAREVLTQVIKENPNLKKEPGFGQFVPILNELGIQI